MLTLNQNSIKAFLLGHDPLEPNATLIYGSAEQEGTEPMVVYLALSRNDVVGQGLTLPGKPWNDVVDFYTQRYSEVGVAMEIELEQIVPKQRGMFIQISQVYLRSLKTTVESIEQPEVSEHMDADQLELESGTCRSPEAFSRHVQILAKDMSNFQYKYDHLAMFAALSFALSKASGDIDLVKKASLYEDDTKLQGVTDDFKRHMSDLFAMDDGRGGHSLIAPAAATRLAKEADTRDLLHMLIGIVGEAGEIAEQIHEFLTTGQLRLAGKESLPEELGDLRFYISGALRCLGITEADNNQMNYDKLKVRYPAGFTNHAALNRDLEAEGAALTKE